MSIRVGDKVFVVHKTYRSSDVAKKGYETVTRVGRKYFYIGTAYGEQKFCMETLREANDGNYWDQAYLCEVEYERSVRKDEVVSEIKSIVGRWGWYKKAPLDKLEVILNTLKEHE